MVRSASVAPVVAIALLLAACGAPTPWQAMPADVVLSYAVSAQATSTADPSALGASGDAVAPIAQPLKASVTTRGTLEVALTGRRADGSQQQAVRIRDAAVSVAVDGGGGPATELAAALDRWTWVTTDARGRVLAVRSATDQAPAATQMMVALLAATQVVRPPAGGQVRTWETHEENPSGRYTAAYAVVPEGDAVRVTKRALRYEAPPTLPNELAPVHTLVPSGGFVARMRPTDGVVLGLDGDETLETQVHGRTLGTTTLKVSLRLTHAGALEPRLALQLAELRAAAGPARPMFLGPDDPEVEAALQADDLGGASAVDVLARLDRAATERPGDADHAALFRALEALLVQQPQTAPSVGARLARWSPQSPAFSLAAAALTRAGHADAQVALLTALRAHRDDADQGAVLSLIAALGRASHPTPASEAALRELAGDPDANLASTARLALGATARRLLTSAPERAQAIGRWAADALAAVPVEDDPDAPQLQHWLRVLGNAGDAAPAGVVDRYLHDSRPAVQATAQRALRFVTSPR